MRVLKSCHPDSEATPNSAAWIFPVQPNTESATLHHAGESEDPKEDSSLSEGGASSLRGVASHARRNRNITLKTPILPPFAAAFAVRFGGSAAAYQCKKHIADAQALIDRISARIESDAARMPDDWVALIHALLDDARFMLAAARHNHEQSQAPFDHARAFAKADVAFGHARAAELICARHALRPGIRL